MINVTGLLALSKTHIIGESADPISLAKVPELCL
jgi:hypothetical protein